MLENLKNLLDSIFSNPAYLAVTIALCTMIIYGVIKRLYKLVAFIIVSLIVWEIVASFTEFPSLRKYISPYINEEKLKEDTESFKESIKEEIEQKKEEITGEVKETVKKNLKLKED
tara:strand:+ start:236 stop:583 length:348 start_codon:yes stop_codon:yes gene_type:complete